MQNRNFKLFIVLSILWVGCQSCLQFRKSDKKQLKVLSILPEEFTIYIGHKSALGRDIHFTHISSSKGLPLAIFIHGSPGSSSNFLHFGTDTALLNNYDVLLLDRPGFGYSDFGNSEPSILRQADILNEIVAQFSAKEKVLIGHSLGGPIIANMAMKKPEEYKGLLILAGSVSPELEPEENWRKPLNSPLVRWIIPRSFCVSNQEILPAKEELLKMEEYWNQIIADVQIIQGEEDKLVPAGNANYAKDKLVSAGNVEMFILPKEDHFIPFTKPKLVTEALLRFLSFY